MGQPSEPEPVKLFVGVMSSRREILSAIETDLSDNWGMIEERSATFSFDYTDYYDSEMGDGLVKRFLSFEDLIDPGRIGRIKLETNQIEKNYREDSRYDLERPINLDPGYIGLSKLVLASTKNYSHRIDLENGIYAEVTLCFEGGDFLDLPWTYPDYRSEGYKKYFKQVRGSYKEQLRR